MAPPAGSPAGILKIFGTGKEGENMVASVIILLVVILVCGMAVRSLIRDKKRGKGICGDCSACGGCSACGNTACQSRDPKQKGEEH